jgi:hypothetical protein
MISPPMCLFTTAKLKVDRVGATKPNFYSMKQFSAFFSENLVIETRFIAWVFLQKFAFN